MPTRKEVNKESLVAFAAANLSPRLVILQKRLDAGDHRALEEFWKEVAAKGAPSRLGV